MRRRTFLRRVAGVGAVGLAGCLGETNPQFTITETMPPLAPVRQEGWVSNRNGYRNARNLETGTLPSLTDVNITERTFDSTALEEHGAVGNTVYALGDALRAVGLDGVQWTETIPPAKSMYLTQDSVYVAIGDSVLRRNRQTGEAEWGTQLGKSIILDSIDYVGPNTILVRGQYFQEDMVVVALRPRDGAELWSFRTRVTSPSQQSESGVVIGDSYVFAGSAAEHGETLPDTGYIHSITPASGTFDWTRRLETPIEAIAANSDTIVVETLGDLRLLNPDTGIVEATMEANFDGSFALTDDALIVGHDETLYRYNLRTKQADWEASLPTNTSRYVLTDGETILTASTEAFEPLTFATYDAATGEQEAQLTENVGLVGESSSLVASDDVISFIAVGISDATHLLLSPESE